MGLAQIARKHALMLWVLGLFLLSIPTWWSLLHPGFFPTHDGNWFLIRLTEFHRMLRDGQFPIRYGTNINFGYGYPVFTFVYPLPFMIMEMFHLAGFGFVDAYKLLLGLAFPLSAIGFFLWLRQLGISSFASFVGGAFYMFTPYRFVDVYVRGTVGEATAFIFPPFALWGLELWLKEKRRIGLLVFGFSIGALLLAHNILALFFFLWILGYCVLRCWRASAQDRLLSIASMFLGVGASLFFWIPALVEQQFVRFPSILVSDFFSHFPTLNQLLFSPWGYGYSVEGSGDGMTFQLGFVYIAFLIVATIFFFLKKIQMRSFFLYAFLTMLGAIFLMLEQSKIFWEIGNIHRFVQYPWRLLSLTTFTTAVIAACALDGMKQKEKLIVCALSLLTMLTLAFPMIKPQKYENLGDMWYATNDSPTTIADEYMPQWVQLPLPPRPTTRIELESGQAEITLLTERSNRLELQINAKTESVVRMNTIDYPGWSAMLDGLHMPIRRAQRTGVMLMDIPEGVHHLSVRFGETWWRFVADGVSIASVAGLSFLTLWRKK